MLTTGINHQGRRIQPSFPVTFPNLFSSLKEYLQGETADEYKSHCKASHYESVSFSSGTVEFSVLLGC